jgi:hypothetical protein
MFTSFTDIATLILVQFSFLFSLSFLLWFGITRRWQADDFGVNLFLTALSTVIVLLMAEVGLFWPEQPWRGWVRVVGWGIFAFVWGQRLWFLLRDTRRRGRKDPTSND